MTLRGHPGRDSRGPEMPLKLLFAFAQRSSSRQAQCKSMNNGLQAIYKMASFSQ